MKMSKIIEVALNGDAPDVDPAVRRALYSMANEFDDTVDDFRVEVRGIRKLLLTLVTAVITGILVAIANVLIAL
jgi:hypothetical protein